MNREVAVIGTGIIQFGELWTSGIAEMSQEVISSAIKEANIEKKEIDQLFVGSMSPGRFSGQEHVGAYVASYNGLRIPATRVEGACASGGISIRLGYQLIKGGLVDTVLCVGVEKMTDLVSGGEATTALGAAADALWETQMGITFPGLYAMMAQAHMAEYGTTKEMLAAVAVKNHKNAMHNPYAHFRREFTIEQVINSRKVAPPLGILDCSPISDGAAAVILTTKERAKDLKGDDYIQIIGSGHGTDTIGLHERKHIPTTQGAVDAAKMAFADAGISPSNVNLAEVHDCFTIAEIVAIEDIGFFPKGEGGPATLRGDTAINGKIPINTSGGLKAKGHPVGATGVAQAIEMYFQLRGKANERQVKDAEIGLTHNVGGSGATAVVHLYKKPEA